MKVYISAAAIQLTLGLDDYILSHFSEVIVYPSIFKSRTTGNMQKGETNAKGAVTLSWNDFQEGYRDPTDKLNLGLHEWTHALMLSNQMGIGEDELFTSYYRRWYFEAKPEFEELQHSTSPLLRDYAATNMAEFFAVCVETFFEQPQAFLKEEPNLFKQLATLLNQNPVGAGALPNKPFIQQKIDQAASNIIRYQLNPASMPGFNYASLITRGAFAALGIFFCFDFEFSAPMVSTTLAINSLFVFAEYYDRRKFSNFSLLLYDDRLTVCKKDEKVTDHFFHNLASIGINESDNHYLIEFKYPENGNVATKLYAFRFSEQSISMLREELQKTPVPVFFGQGHD